MATSMRIKVLIAAGVMGLLTAGLVYLFVARQVRAASAPVPIVIARRDIPAGTVIDTDMLEIRRAPKNTLPPDAVLAPEMVVGKAAAMLISAGQTLTFATVAPKSRLSQQIPPNMRAVTVGIDPVSGVGGFLAPGDRVDVMGTFNVDGGTLTKIVLQDVLLLATGTQALVDQTGAAAGAQPGPQAQATATLAVDPEQAQMVTLAASKGKLTLALRRFGDQSRTPTRGVTGRVVVGIVPPDVPKQPTAPGPPQRAAQPAPAAQQPGPATQPAVKQPPKPAAPKGNTITIIRGTKTEQVVVPK